jgi:hypothetical protein
MRIFGPVAAEEGVEGVQPMHETGILQKLERSVHRLRGWIAAALRKLGKNLVSADRLVLPPYDLEDSLADGGEIEPFGCTNSLGRRDGVVDAARMVVGRPQPWPLTCS